MSARLNYYHLHTNTMNPCSISKTAAVVAKSQWLCPGCNYPKREVDSIDVTIQEPAPENEPLNFIYGFGVSLAKKSLITLFSDDLIKQDLHLGRVFLENEGQIQDWVTFRGRESLIIRGTKNVSHRRCLECGRNVYFALGESYLFPSPSSNHDIFVSDLFGLIVSQKIFRLMKFNKWPKLLVDKLPVLSAPKDGLPEITSFYSQFELEIV